MDCPRRSQFLYVHVVWFLGVCECPKRSAVRLAQGRSAIDASLVAIGIENLHDADSATDLAMPRPVLPPAFIRSEDAGLDTLAFGAVVSAGYTSASNRTSNLDASAEALESHAQCVKAQPLHREDTFSTLASV